MGQEKTHWRLRCSSGAPAGWNLCNVSMYQNGGSNCNGDLVLATRKKSQSNGSSDPSTLCTTSCEPDEAWVAHKIDMVTKMQCIILNERCTGTATCDTMVIDYSNDGSTWTTYATFNDISDNKLDVCAVEPTECQAASPTPAPNETEEPVTQTPKTNTARLENWSLLQETSPGNGNWKEVDKTREVPAQPTAVKMEFTGRVKPITVDGEVTKAHMQVVRGPQVNQITEINIPPGLSMTKQFPPQTLQEKNRYKFYIAKGDLIDFNDNDIEYTRFEFSCEGVSASSTSDNTPSPAINDSTTVMDPDNGLSTTMLAAIGAGGVFILLLIVLVLIWFRRRKAAGEVNPYRKGVAPQVIHQNASNAHHIPNAKVKNATPTPTPTHGGMPKMQQSQSSHQTGQSSSSHQRRSSDQQGSGQEHVRPPTFSKDDFTGMPKQKPGEQHQRPRSPGAATRPPLKRQVTNLFADAPQPLTDEGDEIKKLTEELAADFAQKRKDPLASRKKDYKFIMLRWHPDKNPDNLEIATRVFQYIQDHKDWYLNEKEVKK